MPISNEDRSALKRAGFIPWEIQKLDEAVYPDGRPQVINFDAEVWKAARQSRHAWISDKLDKGWSRTQIAGVIMGYYTRKSERSPFDFLKVEYKPPRKLTDYQAANQQRIRKNIQKKLELSPGYRYR